MNQRTVLFVAGILLGATGTAIAETTAVPATAAQYTAPAPVKPVAPAPAAAKPAASAPVATHPAAPAPVPVPATTDAAVAPPVLTPEQRHQQEVLANAERVDKANRDLLAKNQELQLLNENLALQNNQLKHDRSSDGIWKGAFAVIIGFLMGWYFSGGGRRRSSW